MKNSTPDFIFRTRTFEKDYSVLLNYGIHAENEEEKFFDDTLLISGMNDTEEPLAGLCNIEEIYYVLAVGFQTGNKDKVGRPIRFSFCGVFLEAESALKTFNNLIHKWNAAEKKLNFFIDQKLYQENEINFDYKKFIQWLNEEENTTEQSQIERPQKNQAIKWKKEASEIIYVKLKNTKEKKNKCRNYIFYCTTLIILAVAGASALYFMKINSSFFSNDNIQEVRACVDTASEKVRDALEKLAMLSDDIRGEIRRAERKYRDTKFKVDNFSTAGIDQAGIKELSELTTLRDVLKKNLHQLSEDKALFDTNKSLLLSASTDIKEAYALLEKTNINIEQVRTLSEQAINGTEKIFNYIEKYRQKKKSFR